MNILEKTVRRVQKYLYNEKINFDKNYKYVHVFMQNDFKFNLPLAQEISNDIKPFSQKDTLIITPHWNVYYLVKKNSNAFYLPQITAEEINALGRMCDWIFIHALNFQEDEILNIDREIAPKIIWRTWGHDVIDYNKAIKNSSEKNRIKLQKVKNRILSFRAIAGENDVDLLNIRKKIGKIDFLFMPYTFKDVVFEKKKKEEKITNILIGHSGFKSERLIENLEAISHFKDEKICVYLILSYGEEEYIKETEIRAKEIFKDKVHILKEFIKLNDYLILLQSVDVAIMDQIKSAALGNIELLVYFDKKLFLNPNGIIHEAFDLNELPYGNTDEICTMSFGEFSKPVQYDPTKKERIQYRGRKENLELWANLLEEIELNITN